MAAACGGITTICDYAFPEPGQSLQDCLVRWNKRGEKSVIDYGLHPTIFQPGEHTLSEMRDCVADGYTSFKIFMIGFAEFDKYAAEYLRCMEEAGKLGAMVNIHCEDQCCISYMTQKLEEENNSNVRTFPDSRPRISEGLAARRALWMAHVADVPAYLVHLSCQEGLDALNDARGRGQTCYGETRPDLPPPLARALQRGGGPRALRRLAAAARGPTRWR